MSAEKTKYVFDVDGVLSDVFIDEIDQEILQLIARKIDAGSKIAFNTGRNSGYILENVIAPLSKLTQHRESLDNVLVVSEMGGERTTFSGGVPTTSHTEFSMKEDDIQIAERIFKKGDYKTIKFESDKATMVSASIIRGSQNKVFLQERDRLQGEFAKAFADKPLEIITTVGSVDVFEKGAGKRGGAKVIGEWLLGQTDVKHDSYVCFGDSPSDYKMAEYFAELDMDVKFVFTGKQDLLPIETAGVPIVQTSGLYTAGTRGYLKDPY
jgi:hydroxymethylpyrimidine pyrophosphatase-like HAD family hydrolase